MKQFVFAGIIALSSFFATTGCDGVDDGTNEQVILKEGLDLEAAALEPEDEQDESELSEFAVQQSESKEKEKPSFESDFDLKNNVNPSAACLMCEDLVGVPCNPPNTWSEVCAWWVTGGLCSGLDQLKCIGGVWQEQ